MKTTVKLDVHKAVVIEPQGEGVKLSIRVGAVTVGSLVLSKDKIGAVMFGIEQAAGTPAPML
jgi:hypothetical protein